MNYEDQKRINPYIINAAAANESTNFTPGKSYGKRRTNSFELEFITGGKGTIITEENNLSATKGDLFFRYPGTHVEGIAGYYSYLIMFDAVYNESRQELYNTPPSVLFSMNCPTIVNDDIVFYIPDKMNIQDYNTMESLFFEIFNSFISSGQKNQLQMKTAVLRIIDIATQEYKLNCALKQNKRSIKNNFDKIMTSKDYIDKNLDKKLSLDMLAAQSGLSKNFYCKIFKEIVGKSPFEYINENKINLAKRLLGTTNKSIIEISYLCGFDDITYFYRVFKNYTNMTPSYFRQLHSYY